MRTLPILSVAALAATPALADLPRSLSFQNESSTRLVPNSPESSNNEKEVEFGDVDLDGDLDIVVAVGSGDFGERRNKIYLNEGGVFTEVSASLIPEFAMGDVSRNAFIRDYTGDGFPDIYIINDSNSGGFAGNDHLYVGLFEDGELVGYSEEGPARIPQGGDLGAACGGVSWDMDGDGDVDVYSGNYPGPSQDRGLINNGAGFLSDQTASLIPTDGDYTVDVALGDMNGDGKMDLLVSNDFDPSYVYYNDNGGAGSGLGDFKYSGSTTNLGTASSGENAMEAADFDGDGDLDIYWTNRNGSSNDRIYRNDGNDGSGKATFTSIDPIPNTVVGATRKCTVADFNEDGRIDAFIANQSGGRPVVLRNTSVEGGMSFVDWTPANAIPGGSSMRGWHAAAFDTGADGDVDLMIGAFNDEHLIENVPANEVSEGKLGGVLPALWNTHPVAVYGTGSDGSVHEFAANDLGSGFISVVVNGPDDYLLEVLNGPVVLASSDRGGVGVEEALQTNVSGARTIRVTVLESAGGCPDADLDGDCTVGFGDLLVLLADWGCTDCAADLSGDGTAGFDDLLVLLAAWGDTGAEPTFMLEVLGRS